jgi:D-sedoheptulose 7-phosphate isomerase
MSRSSPRPRATPPAGARAAAEAHIARLRECLDAVQPSQIERVAERLRQVVQTGGLVLIAGNGGSAATASHMALDLGKSTLGRPPRAGGLRVRTLSLNDPAPVLTAWANDSGYEGVFAEQITTLARPGDAVVLVSVSGTSPNVVAAARAGRVAGATVIALLGRGGGTVRALADLAVTVPSDDYGVVEDVHLAINHMITRYLAGELAGSAGGPRPPAAARAAHRTARASRRGRARRKHG